MACAKPKVLFLCSGNSCRSQMAEGFARALHAGVLDVYSAGLEARGLDPRAMAAMAEVGLDISGQRSQKLAELAGTRFDLVLTVCGHAHETCPAFPGKTRVLHVGFEDPPALAREAASEEEALEHYRRVRDQIREFVAGLPGLLKG